MKIDGDVARAIAELFTDGIDQDPRLRRRLDELAGLRREFDALVPGHAGELDYFDIERLRDSMARDWTDEEALDAIGPAREVTSGFGASGHVRAPAREELNLRQRNAAAAYLAALRVQVGSILDADDSESGAPERPATPEAYYALWTKYGTQQKAARACGISKTEWRRKADLDQK